MAKSTQGSELQSHVRTLPIIRLVAFGNGVAKDEPLVDVEHEDTQRQLQHVEDAEAGEKGQNLRVRIVSARLSRADLEEDEQTEQIETDANDAH